MRTHLLKEKQNTLKASMQGRTIMLTLLSKTKTKLSRTNKKNQQVYHENRLV